MLVTSSINSDIGQHLQFLQCFIQGYFCQLALYSAYLWLPEGESIKGSPRDATLFVYAPFSDPIHPQQRICNRLHFLHCCFLALMILDDDDYDDYDDYDDDGILNIWI